MPIAPKFRTNIKLTSIPPEADADYVKDVVLKFVSGLESGMTPLTLLSRRFNGPLTKRGSSLTRVLSELESAGLLASYKFERLNKTYVFSEQFWSVLTEEWERGENVSLPNVENLLIEEQRSLKGKRRTSGPVD